MEECKYHFKFSERSEEVRYLVTDEELVMRSYKKGTKRIPLRNVVQVRFNVAAGQSFCTVTSRDKIHIAVRSRVLNAAADAASPPSQYEKFLECLHERIIASGARPTWIAGANVLFAVGIFSTVMATLSLLMFLFSIVFMHKAAPQALWPMFILYSLGGPLMLKGKAQTYSPRSIPRKYLFE